MFTIAVLVIMIFTAMQYGVAGSDQGTSKTGCVRLPAVIVQEGQGMTLPLFSGLDFELRPDGPWGWDIRVHPHDDPALDYVWPVSPPYQTAPHRKIGPGYGLTAEESTRIERKLRFAVNQRDYDAAFAAASTRPLDPDLVYRVLDRLKTGSLELKIIESALRDASNPTDGSSMRVLANIRLEGEACLPR